MEFGLDSKEFVSRMSQHFNPSRLNKLAFKIILVQLGRILENMAVILL